MLMMMMTATARTTAMMKLAMTCTLFPYTTHSQNQVPLCDIAPYLVVAVDGRVTLSNMWRGYSANVNGGDETGPAVCMTQ